MQLLVVATLTLTVLAPWTQACSSQLSQEEFKGKFCSTDAVFKGVPTQGSSSVAIGEYGEQLESARFTFNVVETFRDPNGVLSSSVDVGRNYNPRTDACDSGFLPDSDDGFLIFATGIESLAVPACDGVLPWDCAPENIDSIDCS